MNPSGNVATYIVYACPTGPLAEQIEAYYAESRDHYGPNKAHDYPPHVTLTGFFQDSPDALPGYLAALADAHENALATRPEMAIHVSELRAGATFCGLIIVSPWLEALTADFAARAASARLEGHLRIKGIQHDPKGMPLHLSLAYGFQAGDGPGLGQMAQARVSPSASVAWILRFYELRDGEWIVHSSAPL